MLLSVCLFGLIFCMPMITEYNSLSWEGGKVVVLHLRKIETECIHDYQELLSSYVAQI